MGEEGGCPADCRAPTPAGASTTAAPRAHATNALYARLATAFNIHYTFQKIAG